MSDTIVTTGIVTTRSMTKGNITWEGKIPPSAELLEALEYFGETYFSENHIKLTVQLEAPRKKKP